jgi:hypothetical protein
MHICSKVHSWELLYYSILYYYHHHQHHNHPHHHHHHHHYHSEQVYPNHTGNTIREDLLTADCHTDEVWPCPVLNRGSPTQSPLGCVAVVVLRCFLLWFCSLFCFLFCFLLWFCSLFCFLFCFLLWFCSLCCSLFCFLRQLRNTSDNTQNNKLHAPLLFVMA